ncbi:MAG TPA: DUF305 domain-containing protein [Gemmatimonadaceae bacterium]
MMHRLLNSLSLAIVVSSACARQAPVHTGTTPGGQSRDVIIAATTQADSVRRSFTDADVHFMSGMIPHHAQAVLIAGWAPTHAARADIRAFCERVVVGQGDEIAIMQNWLRDRGLPVPAANSTHLRMKMGNMEHDMLMPGMLTPEELAQLDSARGPRFDRLFLTFMIRHHEGAITMVEELLASNGAAQDDLIIKLANDIFADQTTEIERMKTILAAMSSGGTPPSSKSTR